MISFCANCRDARSDIDSNSLNLIGEIKGICTGTAIDLINTRSTVESISTGTAINKIIAGTTRETVLTKTTRQRVSA